MASVGCADTLLGGLKAITISDSMQWFGMLLGGLLLLYYRFRYLGYGRVKAGIHTVIHSRTAHLNSIGSAKDAVPFATIFTGMLLVNLYYWGMEQFIMQQALAAKSLKEGQKGFALACTGKLISPLLLNIPCLIAVHLYTDLESTVSVFPRLVRDVMPPVLSGFIAAGIFGAPLNTFNAGFNRSAPLFVINLYVPWKKEKNKKPDDRQLLKAGKKFHVGVALMGICIAPFILFFKGGLYSYIQLFSSVFSDPGFTLFS